MCKDVHLDCKQNLVFAHTIRRRFAMIQIHRQQTAHSQSHSQSQTEGHRYSSLRRHFHPTRGLCSPSLSLRRPSCCTLSSIRCVIRSMMLAMAITIMLEISISNPVCAQSVHVLPCVHCARCYKHSQPYCVAQNSALCSAITVSNAWLHAPQSGPLNSKTNCSVVCFALESQSRRLFQSHQDPSESIRE